jgi:hypothetical protein
MPMFANAGLPMLCVGMPFLAAFLPAIVLIEALLYWRALRVSWSQAWRGSFEANMWSTFLGLPLAWIVWVFAGHTSVDLVQSSGLVTLDDFLGSYTVGFLFLVATSGWLYPSPAIGEVLLLGAGMVLLLPAYLVSYLYEARYLQREWPELDARQVYRQVWLAHVVTYGLLYAVAGWWFIAITRGWS